MPKLSSRLLLLLLGCAVFIALQWGWSAARGSALERLVVHDWTVGVAVWLIGLLTPEVAAQGLGSRISAPGGGINILNGCEGTEVLFLLTAALAVSPGHWRWRVGGLLLGALLVFALNQARVVALFYSFRHDRELFSQLHTLYAPLLMVAATLLYYVAFSEWCRRRENARRADAPAGAGAAAQTVG